MNKEVLCPLCDHFDRPPSQMLHGRLKRTEPRWSELATCVLDTEQGEGGTFVVWCEVYFCDACGSTTYLNELWHEPSTKKQKISELTNLTQKFNKFKK